MTKHRFSRRDVLNSATALAATVFASPLRAAAPLGQRQQRNDAGMPHRRQQLRFMQRAAQRLLLIVRAQARVVQVSVERRMHSKATVRRAYQTPQSVRPCAEQRQRPMARGA